MQTPRFFFISLLVTLMTACAAAPATDAPDARTPMPLDPAGTFALRSTYSLVGPPAPAVAMLDELASATDGVDDPSRYLIDKLVARLPEGRTQLVAAAVAPYLAAYVQHRVDSFAPGLVPGVRAMTAGLNAIARRFGTTEELVIDRPSIDARASRGRHVYVGAWFDGIVVPFAPLGLADPTAATEVVLSGDQLTFASHGIELDYGAMLRLGFDCVVIPRVIDGAHDLDEALHALVDCNKLGMHVADYLGIGSPELYAGACSVALTRLAAEIYERLAAPPVRLTISGSARAVDLNGDGPVDVIADGRWSGTFGDAQIVDAKFDGSAP